MVEGRSYNNTAAVTGRLEIVFYTDPLCCWSRALRPHLARLARELDDALQIRYCMGGLIESWKNYNDTEHAVCKPVQMGPLWMQASHITGIPMNSTIWATDPPESSYLACTAVKAVHLQDGQAAAVYFHLLQDALMGHGVNIARQRALITVAAELAAVFPAFDLQRFKDDLVNGEGFKAFAADLAESRARNITRFPTLLMSTGTDKGAILTGYKPYETIIDYIEKLAGYDTRYAGA